MVSDTQNLCIGCSEWLTFPCSLATLRNGPQNIYNLYEQVSYNCFIAAGLYLVLGGFSFCQVRLNKRKEYMVR